MPALQSSADARTRRPSSASTSIRSASALDSDVATRLTTAMRDDGREVVPLAVSNGGRWDSEVQRPGDCRAQ